MPTKDERLEWFKYFQNVIPKIRNFATVGNLFSCLVTTKNNASRRFPRLPSNKLRLPPLSLDFLLKLKRKSPPHNNLRHWMWRKLSNLIQIRFFCEFSFYFWLSWRFVIMGLGVKPGSVLITTRSKHSSVHNNQPGSTKVLRHPLIPKPAIKMK